MRPLCLACDQHIPPDRRVDAKYCSVRCQRRAGRVYRAEYRVKHRAEATERMQLWRKRNPEGTKASSRACHKRHPERCARRRAARLQALPKWLSPEQLLKIRDYYQQAAAATKATGVPHAVDHIVPLCGVNVCGLHVPWNLQVLTRSENCKKGATLQVSEED